MLVFYLPIIFFEVMLETQMDKGNEGVAFEDEGLE